MATYYDPAATVDGLTVELRFWGACGKNKPGWSTFNFLANHHVTFPPRKVMKRLAKTYLGLGYHEPDKRSAAASSMYVHIEAGTSVERRAAFVGAVCSHTKRSD